MHFRKVRCPHELYYANNGLHKQHACYRSERQYMSFPLEIQAFLTHTNYVTYLLQFAKFFSKLKAKMSLEEAVKDTNNSRYENCGIHWS